MNFGDRRLVAIRLNLRRPQPVEYTVDRFTQRIPNEICKMHGDLLGVQRAW